MVMELEPWPEASQGEGRVINVEDWAEIRRLNKAEGMGVKAISRRLGIARNTVRTALRSDQPPRYEREGPGSIVDAVEPDVRELIKLRAIYELLEAVTDRCEDVANIIEGIVIENA